MSQATMDPRPFGCKFSSRWREDRTAGHELCRSLALLEWKHEVAEEVITSMERAVEAQQFSRLPCSGRVMREFDEAKGVLNSLRNIVAHHCNDVQQHARGNPPCGHASRMPCLLRAPTGGLAMIADPEIWSQACGKGRPICEQHESAIRHNILSLHRRCEAVVIEFDQVRGGPINTPINASVFSHYIKACRRREDSEEKEICGICLDPMVNSHEDHRVGKIRSCGHAFHLQCLAECYSRMDYGGRPQPRRCPMCRAALRHEMPPAQNFVWLYEGRILKRDELPPTPRNLLSTVRKPTCEEWNNEFVLNAADDERDWLWEKRLREVETSEGPLRSALMQSDEQGRLRSAKKRKREPEPSEGIQMPVVEETETETEASRPSEAPNESGIKEEQE